MRDGTDDVSNRPAGAVFAGGAALDVDVERLGDGRLRVYVAGDDAVADAVYVELDGQHDVIYLRNNPHAYTPDAALRLGAALAALVVRQRDRATGRPS